VQILQETGDLEAVAQVELREVPDCEETVLAAGHQLVVVMRVNAETVDALHVVGQRSQHQPEYLRFNQVPHPDHSVLAPADDPEFMVGYLVESSSLMTSVTFPRLHSVMRWISFPFLGENMRMQSSLHPDTMYFPFLGKCRERQTAFSTRMRRAGAKLLFFQIITSPPELVPKI
jgi:hypothetical protein